LLVTVSACCQFTRQSVSVPSTGVQQVMIARKELADRPASMNPMPNIPPAENDCLKFLVSPEELEAFESVVRGLGDIATGGATAIETEASGAGLKECWSNQPSTVIVTPRDHNGKVVKVCCRFCFGSVSDGFKRIFSSNYCNPLASFFFCFVNFCCSPDQLINCWRPSFFWLPLPYCGTL